MDPFGEDWVAWLGAASNFSAGFADTVTFGLTRKARQAWDTDRFVNHSGGVYTTGQITGTVAGVTLGGVAAAKIGVAVATKVAPVAPVAAPVIHRAQPTVQRVVPQVNRMANTTTTVGNNADNIKNGVQAINNNVANVVEKCPPSSPVVANIGTKLDYLLGRATGSAHNIQRSKDMLNQLERIGLRDTPATRQLLTEHLQNALNQGGVVQENGRILSESLLMGRMEY